MRHFFSLLLILFVFFSCQYFNAFFNAEKSFTSALKEIQKIDATLSDRAGPFSYANDQAVSSAVQKNLQLSIKQAWKIIEFYGDSASYADDALFLIGRSHFYLKEFPKSIELFSDFIDQYPESEYWQEVWLWLADSYMANDDTTKAQNILESASLKNFSKENEVKVLTRRGALAFNNNNLELALSYFNQALRVSDDDYVKMLIHLKLSEGYLRIKDYDKALLNASIAYDEDVDPEISRKALRQLIMIYIAKKDIVYTLKWIEEGRSNLEFLVDFPWYELQKGHLYLKRGNWEKAKDQWLTVIEEYPGTFESALAALNISDYYRTQKVDYDSSFKYISKVKSSSIKNHPREIEYFNKWNKLLKNAADLVTNVITDTAIISRYAEDSVYYDDEENFQFLLQEFQLEQSQFREGSEKQSSSPNKFSSGVAPTTPSSRYASSRNQQQEDDLDAYYNPDSLRSILDQLIVLSRDSAKITYRDSIKVDSLSVLSGKIQRKLFKGISLKFKNVKAVKDHLQQSLFKLSESMLIEFEDYISAKEYYQKYLTYFKSDTTHMDRVLFALGYIDWREGKNPENILFFDTILNDYPDSPSAGKVKQILGIQLKDEKKEIINQFERRYHYAQEKFFQGSFDSTLSILSELYRVKQFQPMKPKLLLMKAMVYREGLKQPDSLYAVYQLMKKQFAKTPAFKNIEREYKALKQVYEEKTAVPVDTVAMAPENTVVITVEDTTRINTLTDTTNAIPEKKQEKVVDEESEEKGKVIPLFKEEIKRTIKSREMKNKEEKKPKGKL